MLQAKAQTTLSFHDLKERGDRAKARARQMREDAVTGLTAFPTENLSILKRTWSSKEVKVRGDRAKARAVELREQTTGTRNACEKLLSWLDSIHGAQPLLPTVVSRISPEPVA